MVLAKVKYIDGTVDPGTDPQSVGFNNDIKAIQWVKEEVIPTSYTTATSYSCIEKT